MIVGMSEEAPETPEGGVPAEILLPPEMLSGVWANWAQVSHSPHEFTLDFVRIDSTAPPPGRGIVVARVSVSPLFVTQLIDALTDNWRSYAEKAMPEEYRRNDQSDS
jgi:hypothetical protein